MAHMYLVFVVFLATIIACLAAPPAADAENLISKDNDLGDGSGEDIKDLDTAEWFFHPWLWAWAWGPWWG